MLSLPDCVLELSIKPFVKIILLKPYKMRTLRPGEVNSLPKVVKEPENSKARIWTDKFDSRDLAHNHVFLSLSSA